MTSREFHLLSTVPVAFGAVALGYHPIFALPLVVGVLLPEVDALREETHRSWLFHTLLFPALVYIAGQQIGLFSAVPGLLDGVHFLTVGMTLHLLADYVYPREMDHNGTEWPVRPTVRSEHTGLIFMGLSWAVQWLLYLAPAFLPWLFGAQ